MYKDREKQKEAVRKAVEKHRKGITAEGITEQGITYDCKVSLEGAIPVKVIDTRTEEPWYPNKPTDGQGQPITPVVLSDGQKWYPSPIGGETMGLPNHIYHHIVEDGRRFGRLKERISKALEYQEWGRERRVCS